MPSRADGGWIQTVSVVACLASTPCLWFPADWYLTRRPGEQPSCVSPRPRRHLGLGCVWLRESRNRHRTNEAWMNPRLDDEPTNPCPLMSHAPMSPHRTPRSLRPGLKHDHNNNNHIPGCCSCTPLFFPSLLTHPPPMSRS